MIAWVFGQSSEFSKNLISELENNNITVHGFGRGNLDYLLFDDFISGKTSPDYIILNANIEEQIAIEINDSKFSMLDVGNMFNNYLPIFTFFLKLIKWVEEQDNPTKICAISSSITAWPQKNKKHVTYSVLRAMLQQVVFSASNSVTTAFCVSPSGIDTSNSKEYAKRIIQHLIDGKDLLLMDLSNQEDTPILDLHRYKNE